MIHPLAQRYASRHGTPVIAKVDLSIFRRRYFTRCSSCTFCGDSCCQHGVDVDLVNVERILARADALETYLGVPRDRWFLPTVHTDAEMPGGGSRSSRVVDGMCVFHTPGGRGCRLHRFALETGLDYHELKPMVSTLFPLTFDDETLLISEEVTDGSLVCLDQGPTVYRGARDEVRWHFGDALVAELDAIESGIAEVTPWVERPEPGPPGQTG